MGDFERTFGAGADLDAIIDRFSRDHRAEQHRSQSKVSIKRYFSSFQEACVWAKSHPGKAFRRDSKGKGFVEV